MNTERQPPGNPARTDELVKDPTERFKAPAEVLDDRTLNLEEKRQILASWVKDSELLAEAESENMGGGESARLRESKLALAALDTPPEPDKVRP